MDYYKKIILFIKAFYTNQIDKDEIIINNKTS